MAETTFLTSVKAAPFRNEEMPDLVITFSQPADGFYPEGDVDEPPHVICQRRYRQAADQVIDAMQAHLPGGLLDGMFASLCARKAACLSLPDVVERHEWESAEASRRFGEFLTISDEQRQQPIKETDDD